MLFLFNGIKTHQMAFNYILFIVFTRSLIYIELWIRNIHVQLRNQNLVLKLNVSYMFCISTMIHDVNVCLFVVRNGRCCVVFYCVSIGLDVIYYSVFDAVPLRKPLIIWLCGMNEFKCALIRGYRELNWVLLLLILFSIKWICYAL